jgi:hypothetical protein
MCGNRELAIIAGSAGFWRYVCEPAEIRCRYSDYELVGAPEVRRVPDDPLSLSAAHLARGAQPALRGSARRHSSHAHL